MLSEGKAFLSCHMCMAIHMYRAPPNVRGSGKERGHGMRLDRCPKCDDVLKVSDIRQVAANMLCVTCHGIACCMFPKYVCMFQLHQFLFLACRLDVVC